MQILIVDDDILSAEILAHALGEFGYTVDVACNGREAMELVRTGQYPMVISDWEMPEMDGLQLCQEIRRRVNSTYVYVILLTSRSGTQNVVAGLNAGADDFLSKPFQPDELLVRLRAGERILALESRDVTLFTLAKLAESRDTETGAHLERMREYCRILAQYLSRHPDFWETIDGDFVQLIYATSPLHDIGKVGIPDKVLLKPGRLTPEEFEIMKQHTVIGGQTLDAAASAFPNRRFLQLASEIAWTHHEKFNGTGYPRGLSGIDIPLSGRIVAIADVYDALTSKRVYKRAMTHEESKEIILEGRGSHFDPDLVDAFLACEQQFLEIKERFEDAAAVQPTTQTLAEQLASAEEGN